MSSVHEFFVKTDHQNQHKPNLYYPILTVLFCLLLVKAPSAQTRERLAQTPTPPAETAPLVAENAIPFPEIADRLNELSRLLRSIKEKLSFDNDLAAITEYLNTTGETLTVRARSVERAIAESLTFQDIEEVEAEWRDESIKLEQWTQTLSRRAIELQDYSQRLEKEQHVWEQTFNQYQGRPGIEVVLERIKTALVDIRQTSVQMQSQRQRVSLLQNELVPQELITADLLAQIEYAKERLRRSLFTRDRVPFWQAWRETDVGTSFFSLARQSFTEELANLKDLITAKWLSLVLILLVYFAAASLAYFLSRKVSLWTGGQKGTGDSELFYKYPITIAFIAATLSSFWLPALAPVRLSSLVYSLLFISLLFLLPPLFPGVYRPLLFVLAFGFVSYRIRGAFVSAPVVERTISVVSLAIVIGLTIWLLRPARLRNWMKLSGIPLALVGLIWVMTGLLAVTLIANLFGYVGLSRVIGRGAISSLAVGIILYGSARILNIAFSLILQTRWLQSLASIQLQSEAVYRWFSRTVFGIALLLWLYSSLVNFTVADEAKRIFNLIFKTPIELGALNFTLWNITTFVLVVLAAFFASKAVQFFLREDVMPKVTLQRGMSNAILTTIRYGLLLAGFLLAMGAAGLDLTKFTVLAGAFGVGIGFGLQNIFNNFISGLILLYERPVNLEDLIEIGGVTGTVKRIGIRSSTIRTFQGADLIVPNSNLISNQFTNWTHSDQIRRLEIKIGVAYGTDPERVLNLLLDVAKANPKVDKDPQPVAVFRGFGDSSLNFELRVWVNYSIMLEVESELCVALNDALNKADIKIPFPQRDLNLISVPDVLTEKLSQKER